MSENVANYTPSGLGIETALAPSLNEPYFVLSSTPGPGPDSSLQSPASILPEAGTGQAQLTIANAVGGGVPVLSVSDTTGTNAQINITNAAGGNSSILMGQPPNAVQLIAPLSNGQFQVQSAQSGLPYLLVDTSANGVTLGNIIGAVGQTTSANKVVVASPSVSLATNALTVAVTGNATSSISQSVSSQGVLTLGSSTAFPTVVQVADFMGVGSLSVTGGGGVGSLLIRGGMAGTFNTCSIFPQAANGILDIGSGTANTDAIKITDSPQNQTVVKNLIPPAISTGNNILFAGPFATGGGNYIPAPVGLVAGVYMMAINGIASSYFAQASCLAYWTGSVWGSGGAMVTPGNGTGVLSIFPDLTTAGVLYYENTTSIVLTASLILIPLFVGNIPSLA